VGFEDFKMFEDWNKSQQELAAQAAVPRKPVLVPASWGKRVGAYLIDSVLLAIPLGIFAFSGAFSEIQARMPELVDPVTGQANPAAVEELAAQFAAIQLKMGLGYLVLAGAYYIIMHGLMGQTVGKMALGMTVVNADGSPISFGTAAKRAVVFPIGSVIPYVGSLLALLNGFWPLWEEKRQSLGDKVAGTLVVEVPD
jgi:uncharacterized RDD family membrane protein YckC